MKPKVSRLILPSLLLLGAVVAFAIAHDKWMEPCLTISWMEKGDLRVKHVRSWSECQVEINRSKDMISPSPAAYAAGLRNSQIGLDALKRSAIMSALACAGLLLASGALFFRAFRGSRE